MCVLRMADLNSSRVRVHSVLTVVSSIPLGPGKVHKFTELDNAMGLHTVHEVFYYTSNPFKDGPMAQDLDNLRISLAELLCMYPPVTGRLTRGSDGNWQIKCNDAGVRMIRARVETTLDEWLRSANAEEERDLTLWEDMPDDPRIWSPFRIQINDFACGGMAIGISCPHMHADLTTATQLLKSWSEIHRGVSVANPPFFTLPSFIGQSSYHIKSAEFYETESKAESPSVKMSTATFKFSNSMIKKYLVQVHEICPDATPFDVLAALFWSRITQLKAAKQDQKYSLSICLDLRKLRNKPIPGGYFGNALHFSELSLNAEELGNDRLGHAARLVHQHVASIQEEDLWSSKDWFEIGKDENGKYAAPFRMYGPELTCVSMEEMISPQSLKQSTDESLIYAAIFKKDEKPIHVSYHIGNVEGEGLVIVMPTHEGGLGRTVVLTLPEEHIAGLHEDQAILELDPVVLISERNSPKVFMDGQS